MKFLGKNKITTGLLVFLAAFTGAFYPAHAQILTGINVATDIITGTGVIDGAAGFITNIAAGAVTGVAYIINYIVSWLGGVALWLSAQFVNAAIYFNTEVLTQIMDNGLVHIGWSITRDLANLGFVLAIVAIGFATILRVQRYQAQSLLPKLIGAAIIVNFSLAIGGLFIDFSNVLTNFFIDRSTSGSAGFSGELVRSLGTQKFLDISDNTAKGQSDALSALNKFGASSLTAIASVFFVAAFTILSALTMLAIGIMLLIRFVYLSILLILAPIFWLFWVIPELAGEFSGWWNKFLKWVFYAPTLAFFLYLAIVSASSLNSLTSKAFQTQVSVTGVNTSGNTFIKDFAVNASDTLLIIALLIAGLMAAQSISTGVGGNVLSIAKKMGGGVAGLAGKGAARVGRRALILGAGSDVKGRSYLERLSATKFGQVASRVPGVGRLVRGASNISSNAKAYQKKEVEDEEKKYENITADSAVNELNSSVTRGIVPSNAKLVALGVKAAKDGKWENIDKTMQNQIISAVRTTGTKEKLLGYIPHEAAQFKENSDKLPEEEFKSRAIQEAVAKYVADATKLDSKILEKIAPYLRQQHLNQIGNLGTDQQQDAVKNTLEDRANKKDANGKTLRNAAGESTLEELQVMRVNLDKQLKAIEDAKAAGASKQDIQNKIDVRDTTRKSIKDFIDGLNKEQRGTIALLDSMKKALSWQDKFSQEERTIPT